jgi:hypothetical protein
MVDVNLHFIIFYSNGIVKRLLPISESIASLLNRLVKHFLIHFLNILTKSILKMKLGSQLLV